MAEGREVTDAKGRAREPRRQAERIAEGAAKEPPGSASQVFSGEDIDGEDQDWSQPAQGGAARHDVQIDNLVSNRNGVDRDQSASRALTDL
jgi:hypothetical protein